MENSQFVQSVYSLLGNKTANTKKHGNLLFSSGILYSYGTHYPLQFKIKNYIFVNTSGYSATTGRHIGLCERDFEVKLHFIESYSEVNKKNVLKALKLEKECLEKEISELSKRAWKQRENKENRISEIKKAINTIK